jgi:hypothetical protein
MNHDDKVNAKGTSHELRSQQHLDAYKMMNGSKTTGAIVGHEMGMRKTQPSAQRGKDAP